MSTLSGVHNPGFASGVVEEKVSLVDGKPPNDDEEEYEEYEEEVTDDEAVEVEGPSTIGSVSNSGPPDTVKTETPAAKKPGKVEPTDEVRNMPMSSPSGTNKTSASIPTKKNPFQTFGEWSENTMKQIEVKFPVLSFNNESTNDLTRKTRPEARHWKGKVLFKYEGWVSETIRLSNIPIPYAGGNKYGTDFVYLCLPTYMESIMSKAARDVAPTTSGEKSLIPDKNRWWKIANGVENNFGILDHGTGMFHSRPLASIFSATNKGMICNVDIEFLCKGATFDSTPISSTTPRNIAVNIIRGYIVKVDQDIQGPNKIPRVKVKSQPVATTSDVASDSLMQRLHELGI